MGLRVQKYGGSSVSTPTQICDIARRVKDLTTHGHSVIVVVSAMGKTTDQLVALASQVAQAPSRRELDMLLTTGERVSMALLSMALQDLGVAAISFTGSQAGVLTNGSHSNAFITELKTHRVEDELKKGRVVVLAGFQGVDPHSREITTLGRGGSDTTAVAMAAHFRASRCEILKDVEGVFSADPRLIPDAVHLPHLNYEQLLEMTFWGAKVLHYRSVELAARLQIPLFIALAHGEGRHTLINEDSSVFESVRILAVNSHPEVRKLQLPFNSVSQALSQVDHDLKEKNLPWPQVLSSHSTSTQTDLYVTGPIELLQALDQHYSVTPLASVTVTLNGAVANDFLAKSLRHLHSANIPIEHLQVSSLSLTVFVAPLHLTQTVRLWHAFIQAGPTLADVERM